MKHSISLIINGDPVDAIVKDNLTLLDFLRDQMFLTGTKKGCEEGECGACTGYAKIVEAIQAAADEMNWEEESENA